VIVSEHIFDFRQGVGLARQAPQIHIKHWYRTTIALMQMHTIRESGARRVLNSLLRFSRPTIPPDSIWMKLLTAAITLLALSLIATCVVIPVYLIPALTPSTSTSIFCANNIH
jgi:hypothetical protein